jgi:hypothetical protein
MKETCCLGDKWFKAHKSNIFTLIELTITLNHQQGLGTETTEMGLSGRVKRFTEQLVETCQQDEEQPDRKWTAAH